MRIELEQPAMRHALEFVRAVRASRDLHRGWVSAPRNRHEFAKYVRSLQRENRQGFLVVTPGDELAGVINVNEIVRGGFQSAYLGYYAFEPFVGHGFMQEGLRAVISHCFNKLKLHRLEANVQPENARSLALVRTLGFRREGLSPRYLKISGRWRDHERWAILSDEWRNRKPQPRPVANQRANRSVGTSRKDRL